MYSLMVRGGEAVVRFQQEFGMLLIGHGVVEGILNMSIDSPQAAPFRSNSPWPATARAYFNSH
jgi:hypothetical protein